MIKLCTDPYQKFIDYINEKHLTKDAVCIVVIPTAAIVGNMEKEEEQGFAVYLPEFRTMFVGGDTEEIAEIAKDQTGEDMDEDELFRCMLTSIAHEYMHHLQAVAGSEFNEDEAERVASLMVDDFLKTNK